LVVRRPSVGGVGGGNFTGESTYSGSGDFNNGGTFTLTKSGGGFGTGPTVAFYHDFRGGTNGANIGLSDPQVGAYSSMSSGGVQQPFYVGGAGRDGSSCGNTLTPTLSAADTWAQMHVEGLADFEQCYFARQYKIDVTTGNQNGTNQKDIWFGRDGHFADGDGHDFYPGANAGLFSNSGYQCYNGGSSTSDNPGHDPPNGGFWRRDEWTFHEFGLKPSSPPAGLDELVDYFCLSLCATDGMYQDTSTGLCQHWKSASGPAAWNGFLVPGDYQDAGAGHAGDPPHATHQYWDDMVLQVGANAWSRFLLGDSATFASCTALYYCRPTSWSDGSVTLSLPYTEWPNFSGKHLFRFTNANVRSHVGVG
jgi:hypothetical protein